MNNLLNRFFKKASSLGASAAEIALDCLFPISCAACETVLDRFENKNRLCVACLSKVIIRRSPEKTGGLNIYSPLYYKDPAGKGLIGRLKYGYDKGSATPLANFIAAHAKVSGLTHDLNEEAVIVPIPLHRSRLGERGFNQTEIIAELLGEKLSLSVLPSALVRIKNTKPQSGLEDLSERKKNVSGCFSSGGQITSVRGKTVVLIDDVWTSGATMKEAASVLRRFGAKKIFFLTAAFAGK